MNKTIFSLSLFAAFLLFACGPAPRAAGPQPGDFVEAHVIGTLEDGTEFVNTNEMGQPMIFPFGEQIIFPGWDGMFENLDEGETGSFTIPAEDGFGEEGFGQAGTPGYIPPGSELMFDVEVLKIIRLGYEEIEAGEGPTAEEGQVVRVHYTGTLEDGTQFDSSVERGEPIEFVLGQGMVIPGWDIGIQKMNVGSKAILTIPHQLAYGVQGRPPTIPPEATLIFEVELVEIINQ